MPFADIGDLSICYEIHGEGPRVVLISGTGADLRQNPRRDRHPLTREHRVLMFDQRGLGRTGKPDGPYTMATYADDVARLMEYLGWSRAHIVGTSFGGMVAQHLALHHPDRVDRLVLACTSSGGAGGASYDLLAHDGRPRAERVRATAPIMDTRNDLTTDPPTYAPWFEALLKQAEQPALNADDPNADAGARHQLEARATHDVHDRLGEIAAPTLVLGGWFDGQAPPENQQRLAAAIPGARLEMVDGGHFFLLQVPSTWQTVADFFGE